MRPHLTHVALHVRDLEASVAFYVRHCALRVVHRREGERDASSVAWLAEEGRERDFVLVLLSGGPERRTVGDDFAHLGFAVGSREEVDAAAARAAAEGCLAWPPREEPYPVGYYCGLRDPDGSFVELSYGQPLGPGAADDERFTPRGG